MRFDARDTVPPEYDTDEQYNVERCQGVHECRSPVQNRERWPQKEKAKVRLLKT
jgi:hypothetical protein